MEARHRLLLCRRKGSAYDLLLLVVLNVSYMTRFQSSVKLVTCRYLEDCRCYVAAMNRTGGKFMIVLVLFVAACSGGGDTTEPTTTTSIATTTSSVAQSTTSAAATTTSELVTTTTRYEPEDVASGERPTSFVAQIAFGEEQSTWFHVDLETGTIQRPVDDDEGYILDPLVSPDGRFRFELVSLDRHPRIKPEEVAEFFETYDSEGEWTPEMGPEAAAALWFLPAITNLNTGAVVRWFNDDRTNRWSGCGHESVGCAWDLQGYVGDDYLAVSTFEKEYGTDHRISRIDSPNLRGGQRLGNFKDLYLHPVRQGDGNVVVVSGSKGNQAEFAEPPFSGLVLTPPFFGTIASFAIGDGQTYIQDLDYDESGTWLLATLDNSVEWQGGGQKDFVRIIDPDGRDFYVSRALW